MKPSTPRQPLGRNGDDTRDYIFEMIAELAAMARRTGEAAVAIHLEAILAARRAALEERDL